MFKIKIALPLKKVDFSKGKEAVYDIRGTPHVTGATHQDWRQQGLYDDTEIIQE